MSVAAQQATPRLQVSALSHAYGAQRVLDGVSFEVGRGEIVGLLGPNGSGKSTILSVLQGLLRPTEATVTLEGRRVATGGADLRAAIGVVFQQPSVDKALTARENLNLTLRMQGVNGAARRQRCETLLAWAGLEHRADEPMKQFSGGMLRRIDLVRAVAGSPQLLLMDEPTSGLDEASFRRLWRLVEDLRVRTGMSVLVATHRPEEAARCDRLVVLHGGRVMATEQPQALIDQLEADVVMVTTDDDARAVHTLHEALGVEATPTPEGLSISCARGPELILDVVQALGRDHLTSIALRRPTLADAFVRLSGASLVAMEIERPPAGATSRSSAARRDA